MLSRHELSGDRQRHNQEYRYKLISLDVLHVGLLSIGFVSRSLSYCIIDRFTQLVPRSLTLEVNVSSNYKVRSDIFQVCGAVVRRLTLVLKG